MATITFITNSTTVLMLRFHPECSVSDDISTESDRVKFLQSIAHIALAKARMKLNLKKLYAADGNAVRELLKLAELLYKATKTASSNEEVGTANRYNNAINTDLLQ
jgi:clusterin-associated protein 1